MSLAFAFLVVAVAQPVEAQVRSTDDGPAGAKDTNTPGVAGPKLPGPRTSTQAARRLFYEGVAAADTDRWEDAVGRFEASLSLVERPSTLFNLARGLGRLRRFVEASRALERYFSQPDDPGTREGALALRKEIADRVSQLSVKIAPKSARIWVDDTPWKGPFITPGAHIVRAEADRHQGSQSTIELVPGQTLTLQLSLGVIPEPQLQVQALPVSSPPRELLAPDHAGVVVPVGPVAVGAGGVALLVAGLAAGVASAAKNSVIDDQCGSGTCPSQLKSTQDSADSLALASDLLWGSGAAIIVGAALWWWLDGDGAAGQTGATAGLPPPSVSAAAP